MHVIHTKLNDIGKSGWCNKPSIEILRWDETGSRRGGNGTILSDLPQGNDMIAGLLITLHLVDSRCTCWAPIGDITARIINYNARKRRSACKQFVLQGFVHPRNLPDSEHARCFGRAPVRGALAGLLDVNCGDLESHRRRQGISTGDYANLLLLCAGLKFFYVIPSSSLHNTGYSWYDVTGLIDLPKHKSKCFSIIFDIFFRIKKVIR